MMLIFRSCKRGGVKSLQLHIIDVTKTIELLNMLRSIFCYITDVRTVSHVRELLPGS